MATDDPWIGFILGGALALVGVLVGAVLIFLSDKNTQGSLGSSYQAGSGRVDLFRLPETIEAVEAKTGMDYAKQYEAENDFPVVTAKRRLAWTPWRVISVTMDNVGGETCFMSFNRENGKAYPVLPGASFSTDIDAESIWLWTESGSTSVNFFVTLAGG